MTTTIDTTVVLHGEGDDVSVATGLSPYGIRLTIGRPGSCWQSGEDVVAEGDFSADEADRIADQLHYLASLRRAAKDGSVSS